MCEVHGLFLGFVPYNQLWERNASLDWLVKKGKNERKGRFHTTFTFSNSLHAGKQKLEGKEVDAVGACPTHLCILQDSTLPDTI